MLTFEPARQEDILPLWDLNKNLIDRYEDCASIDYDRVLNWVRKNIETQLPHFQRILSDGDLAGYFCLQPSEEGLELDSLFILPWFQNQGIGTEVLRKCRHDAKDTLFLYVFRENTGAIRLYQRLGFQITKEVGATRYIMEYKKQDC